jgi:hypothetical protein
MSDILLNITGWTPVQQMQAFCVNPPDDFCPNFGACLNPGVAGYGQQASGKILLLLRTMVYFLIIEFSQQYISLKSFSVSGIKRNCVHLRLSLSTCVLANQDLFSSRHGYDGPFPRAADAERRYLYPHLGRITHHSLSLGLDALFNPNPKNFPIFRHYKVCSILRVPHLRR